MRKRLVYLLSVLVLAIATTVTVSVVASPEAAADDCYTWNRTLSQGASGADVTQLQIRVAGWMSSGENLALDGQYGPATANAVKRFQAGYGLACLLYTSPSPRDS